MYAMADRIRLVRALLDITDLRSQQSRTALVAAIENELVTSAVSNARRTENVVEQDVECIVDACLTLPDGLAVLRLAVELKLGGSHPRVQAFLDLCVRLRPLAMLSDDRLTALDDLLDGVPAPTDLESLVRFAVDRDELPSGPARSDLGTAVRELRVRVSPRPLFRLVEAIAAETDDPGAGHELRTWSEANAPLVGLTPDWLAAVRDEFAAHRPPERGYLLLRLRPDKLDEHLFHVTAGCWRGGRYDRVPGELPGPLSLETLAGEIGGLVAPELTGVDRPPIVEFLLPAERLGEPVDTWPLPCRDGADSEFGLECPVVVRPLDPDEPDLVDIDPTDLGLTAPDRNEQQRRRKLAERLRHSDTYDPGAIWWHDCDDPEDDQGDTICAALVCPAVTADEGCSVPLAAGVPAAVWHRRRHDAGQRRLPLERVLKSRALAALPDIVHRQRRSARHALARPDHAGRELVLFWADDPDRSPPQWYPLSAP